jgi:hypothetical protein
MRKTIAQKKHENYFHAFLTGPALILFASNEVWSRSSIQVDGLVVSSDTQCEQPYNNRCVTTYILQSRQTGKKTEYQAASNDSSLRRYLPVGTRIHKVKGHLTYEINGQQVNDFPLYFYEVFLLVGLALVLSGFTRLFLQRRKLKSISM